MKKSKKAARARKSKKFILGGIALVVALTIFLGAYLITARTSNHKAVKSASITIPKFDHIVVIVEENHGDKSILNSPQATYIKSLANQYSYASSYYADGHPSLPNYMLLTSGTDSGVRRNCMLPSVNGCMTTDKNIADLVESSGRNWKAYYEDMPQACYSNRTDLYDPDYNPFIYYEDIAGDAERCTEHVVPFTHLSADLQSNSLPNLVFISPNLCNDMHNCAIEDGDRWLAATATEILDSSAFTQHKSLLIVTWDESEKKNNDNNIPLIFAGRSVKKSYKSGTYYTHADLLKTIEISWGLPALADRDRSAKAMTDFFQ